jgi:hypothetical protein
MFVVLMYMLVVLMYMLVVLMYMFVVLMYMLVVLMYMFVVLMYMLVVFDNLQDEAALNNKSLILIENTKPFEREANSAGGHSVELE